MTCSTALPHVRLPLQHDGCGGVFAVRRGARDGAEPVTRDPWAVTLSRTFGECSRCGELQYADIGPDGHPYLVDPAGPRG